MKLAAKLGYTMAGLVAMGLVAGTSLSAAEDKAAVEIKLPKPAYVGTPKKVPPGVWKPSAKPREPFMAPAGTVLLSLNKPVTGSDKEPVIGGLDQVADGDKEGTEGSWVELAPGLQWVQIDLGQTSTINGVVIWHMHADPRVYKDVVVQIADDQDFIENVQTVFNNDKDNSSGLGLGKDTEYVEYYEGWLIPVNSVKGRYVRLYSNGNTSDDQNHYTEVDVYGVAE